MTAPHDPRAQLQEEVARSLRPVCPGIPDAEFRVLVARIVDVELSHRTAGASAGTSTATAAAAGAADGA